MLPGFAKNLLAAVKTIETTVSSFQAKVKSVEKDLWREYQSLESHLDMRTKKLERLEAVVRNNLALGNGGGDSSSRTARLEEAYRQLKVENHTLRAAAEARAARAGYNNTGAGDPQSSPGGSPSPSIPTGPNAKSKDGSSSRASRIPKSGSRGALRTATMSSATSSQQSRNLLELESGAQEDTGSSSQRPATSVSSSGGGIGGNVMDSKWMLRLRDLEYKLKAEREGRLLDRGEAMKRITASESENVALREGLEREKRRGRAEGGSEGRGR